MKLVLLTNLASTLIMVGIVWFVQAVHYPLYRRINPDAFPTYEVAHVNLVTLVVGPTMIVEAATATLLFLNRPPQIPLWAVLVGLVLVAVIWVMTIFFNVPQHNSLSTNFDEAVHRTLLLTNWVRTISWSLRGLLVLWMVSLLIE